MILKEVKDRNIFDQFVMNHPYSHYMKTSMWGMNQAKANHYSYKMLGFYDGEQLIGTAMVLRGSFMAHPFLYIPKGPCIDYEDKEILKDAFTLLKDYAEKENSPSQKPRINPTETNCAINLTLAYINRFGARIAPNSSTKVSGRESSITSSMVLPSAVVCLFTSIKILSPFCFPIKK